MNLTISDQEYDNLEDKARVGLSKEEYLVIKRLLLFEAYMHGRGANFNDFHINERIIIIITASFGFYVNENGELDFSI